MSLNLRNRDFLKELDFTAEEWQLLLDLARDLKRAKRSGTEVQRMRGKNVALIFEKTSTRTRCAFEVGGVRPGRARHLSRPLRIADGAQGVGRRHRARAVADVRRDRVPRLGAGDRRGARGATPTCRSTTASPTSGTPPRCSRTSSPCASTPAEGRSGDLVRYLGDARSTWATRCSSWARSWAPTCASLRRGSSGPRTRCRH